MAGFFPQWILGVPVQDQPAVVGHGSPVSFLPRQHLSHHGRRRLDYRAII